MTEYLDAWHRYAQFTGRTGVRGYWMFVLMNALFHAVAMIIGRILGLYLQLFLLYDIAMFIPWLAITTRRLHDTGRSAWLQLLWLVPIAGWVLMFIFLVEDSKKQSEHSIYDAQ